MVGVGLENLNDYSDDKDSDDGGSDGGDDASVGMDDI